MSLRARSDTDTEYRDKDGDDVSASTIELETVAAAQGAPALERGAAGRYSIHGCARVQSCVWPARAAVVAGAAWLSGVARRGGGGTAPSANGMGPWLLYMHASAFALGRLQPTADHDDIGSVHMSRSAGHALVLFTTRACPPSRMPPSTP